MLETTLKIFLDHGFNFVANHPTPPFFAFNLRVEKQKNDHLVELSLNLKQAILFLSKVNRELSNNISDKFWFPDFYLSVVTCLWIKGWPDL